MTWAEMGSQMGFNSVVYAFLFGILMALSVSALRKNMIMRRGRSLPSTFMVVIGITGTILCGVLSNLIMIETAVWLVLMFAASGLPMMAESLFSDHIYQIEKELSDDLDRK